MFELQLRVRVKDGVDEREGVAINNAQGFSLHVIPNAKTLVGVAVKVRAHPVLEHKWV